MQHHSDRLDSARARCAAVAFAGALLCAYTLCAPRTACAQSLADADADDARPITGAWPDVALTGGGGIGLGNTPVDSNVFAKLRLGVLYAHEPFVVHAGITGELGALAEHGVGAELEFSHLGGPWLQVGGARVARSQWMGQVTLGFALFGVEWQHRFAENGNALLFLLRLPIGLWWFLAEDEADRKREQARTP